MCSACTGALALACLHMCLRDCAGVHAYVCAASVCGMDVVSGVRVRPCVCMFVAGSTGLSRGAHMCLQQIWGWSAHVCLAVPEPPRRGQAVHTDGASLALPACPAAPLSPPGAGRVLARGMRGRPAGPVLPVVQGGHQGPELAPRRAPAAPESAPPDWRPAAPGGHRGADAGRGSGLGARPTPQVGPWRLPSHEAACAFQWGLGGVRTGTWRLESVLPMAEGPGVPGPHGPAASPGPPDRAMLCFAV